MKDELVRLRITKDQHKLLEEVSRYYGTNKSQLVRALLQKGLTAFAISKEENARQWLSNFEYIHSVDDLIKQQGDGIFKILRNKIYGKRFVS